ncbi:MAG TPA: glycosyltransferase family 2 protein [Candidatus Udaeobacter sp.]|nr:glycosyltransferase family 2 protein [Candidatus Udaeobacter sp.]
MSELKVLAVIPAYNPGPQLSSVVDGAIRELGREAVLVIDDGATDGAGDRARAAGVQVITHRVNRGKGAALRTGFEAALARGADWIFTLDADGQHDPAEMPKFLAAAAGGGAALYIGDRMQDTTIMPWLRRLANQSTSAIISALAGQSISDSQSGYRLIGAQVLRAVDLRYDRFEAESEILIKASRAGFKIGAVPIRTIYGQEQSTIHPVRDTLRFISLVVKLWPHS